MEIWTSPTPNGWKVTIMIEELREAGIALPDIRVIPVDLMKGEQFSKAFTALSPNQKIPALRHGGVHMMESCAILQYLGETFPSALLPDGPERWQVLQWLTWQAANLGPVFGNKLSYTRYMDKIPAEQKQHPLERFSTEAQRLLGVLNRQLGEREYITGKECTIADIACLPWIRAWKWAKVDITGHENVYAWLNRMLERPGVQRGVTYGVKDADKKGWSPETKAKYAKGGSIIADNAVISATTKAAGSPS